MEGAAERGLTILGEQNSGRRPRRKLQKRKGLLVNKTRKNEARQSKKGGGRPDNVEGPTSGKP